MKTWTYAEITEADKKRIAIADIVIVIVGVPLFIAAMVIPTAGLMLLVGF